MTDLVTPGEYGDASSIDPQQTGHAIDKAGVGGWIVNGTHLSPGISVLDETAVNSFTYQGASGLTVTFDGGEAYIGGWLCRDRQTSVDLADNTVNQVYLGYNADATLNSGQAPSTNDNIRLGLASAFDATDPKILHMEIETDGGAVINAFNRALERRPIEYDPQTGTHDIAGGLTVDGNQTLHRTQAWDGNKVVYQTDDGETLEFIRE